MNYDPTLHHRQSIRLKHYDYNSNAAYFITICVQNRECLLGNVANNEMVLNDSGLMVQQVWSQLPDNYPGVSIDTFVVMPNHFHGIIILELGMAKEGQAQGPSVPTNTQVLAKFTITR